MNFRTVTRLSSFLIFLALMWCAAYPFREGFAADFFLRLDPSIALVTLIAVGFTAALAPGIIVLASAMLFGRVFCGHICPLGITIDVGEYLSDRLRGVRSIRTKAIRKTTLQEPPSSGFEAQEDAEPHTGARGLKYATAAAILAAGLFGVSLVYLGSPLSIATRFYGLAVHPIALFFTETAWGHLGPVFNSLGFSFGRYYEIGLRGFSGNLFFAGMVVGIIALSAWGSRFWCRTLCPSGGMLALFSRSPIVHRNVSDTCISCGKCVRECPTAAIPPDDPKSTRNPECIVCLHCVGICPKKSITFGTDRSVSAASGTDSTRRYVLNGAITGLLGAVLIRTHPLKPTPGLTEKPVLDPDLVRPPGALPEAEFLGACVRCGECMKACPTNALQPVFLAAGPEGIFSPVLAPRIGACVMDCNACGSVCPTGAIRRLPLLEKKHAKIGSAWIRRRNCLVWEQDKKCLVCDEVCPYNAVSFQAVPGLTNAAPFVYEHRCTGCGWCENKCPVAGASAIRVNVIGEERLAHGSYIEKAREMGFVFRGKDNAHDKTAPGTFGGAGESAEPGNSDEEIPPGFLPK